MDKELAQRKNIRLKYYDYSQAGYYFITICIKDRLELLGKIIIEVVNKSTPNKIQLEKSVGVALQGDPHTTKIILSEEGKIVKKHIENCNNTIKGVRIDEYIIMPNHIHMIIEIQNGSPRTATPTIPKIINAYKSIVTKEIGYSIWQRNYYEHIIRDEKEYLQIKEYIINNPNNWKEDKYY